MSRYCHVLPLAVFLAIFTNASAADTSAVIDKPQWCPAAIEGTFLPSVAAEAANVVEAFCNGSQPSEVSTLFQRFIANTSGWFDDFGGFNEGAMSPALLKITRDKNQSISIALNLRDNIAFEGKSYSPASLIDCETYAATIDSDASCFNVLNEYVSHYNDAQRTAAFAGRGEVVASLKSLDVLWNDYLVRTKGQTPLEMTINGRVFRKDENADFSNPPGWQQIVLHPTVLFQYAEDARDGERATETLGLELFGINYWKQDKWYLPTGVSLLAAYHDRTDFTDTGLGVAIHWKNKYTLGYTKHGSADVFSISMDLVKLVQSREQTLSKITGLTR